MKNKRIQALMLAICLAAGVTGCGGTKKSADEAAQTAVNETTAAAAGSEAAGAETAAGESAAVPEYLNMDSQMPIVKEGTDITLKIMIVNGALYDNMDSIRDVYFTEAYEKKSGVKVEWIEVSKDAFNDQLALALTTGDLPDIILKSGLSNSNQKKYGEQGYFLNLMENDLLKTYAPNYWALTEKYSDILSSAQMPTGELYSIGMVRNSTGSTVATKMFFNQDWLDAVGEKVPTTSDELYNVLKKFKEEDPNGNGQADEVGFYTSSSNLQNATFGMFGIGNRGRLNGFIDRDPDTGKARYFAKTNGFRQWAEYISKLYSEGLLNKEFFDFTESNLSNHIVNDQCGAFAYTNLSIMNEETQKKFTYLDGTLTGPNGFNDWYGTNSMGVTGGYIITTACEYPEVALRWADYFYSDEGSLFFYFGDEGVTYEALEDGTYKYTDEVMADFISGKDTFDACATHVSLYAYGNTPTMTKVPFNSADDNKGIALEAANALIEDCAFAWPTFTFTSDEQKIKSDVMGDIDSFVKSKRDAWIMGNEELNDDTWNAYVETLEKMGVADVEQIYQNAVERAYERGMQEGYHTLGEYQ